MLGSAESPFGSRHGNICIVDSVYGVLEYLSVSQSRGGGHSCDERLLVILLDEPRTPNGG